MRTLSLEEWLAWGGGAALVILITLVWIPLYKQLARRLHDQESAPGAFLERHNPLGVRVPYSAGLKPLSFTLLPLLAGAFLHRILTSPVPGLVVMSAALLTGSLLWLLPRKKNGAGGSAAISLELETAFLITAGVFIVGLALSLYLNITIGVIAMLISAISFIITLIKVKRREQHSDQAM
jgi:hypothetical protein